MSSNTYTLKIDIDDSKIRELEKRLMAAMNGKLAGMPNPNPDKGGGGGGIAKNIAKLGVIALGVGSLVALVSKITGMIVDSSPMLKGMLKLLNYSVMLILRPIGDFFGFFLRPIVIYFLRSVALPFYKQMRPIMQALGTWLGVNFLSRQSEIDSIKTTSILDPEWDHSAGMQNLEKYALQWASLIDIFNTDETAWEATKEAIASFKGAFTAINGITFPDIDLSAFGTKIDTSIQNSALTIDLGGIQDKIDKAITGIIDFDFDSEMKNVGKKLKAIWDGIFEEIYKIFPFLRPEPEPTPTVNVTVESSQNDIYPWLPKIGGEWYDDPWSNTTNNLGADNQSSGRRF